MIRRPPRSTRTDTLFPYTTLFRSVSKRLTINMGLRWEVNPPPYDANGMRPTLVCGVENLATATLCPPDKPIRSEEQTSELQSLMRISYAVFCLKKKKII